MLRRRSGLRRLAVDVLASTPEAMDLRLLRRLQRALQQSQAQGGYFPPSAWTCLQWVKT